MTGKYKKPNGEIVEVIIFDEINEMMCVDSGGKNSWYHKPDYETWQKVLPETQSFEGIIPTLEKTDLKSFELATTDDIEEFNKSVEEPKKKRTYKKKEK